MSAVTPLAPQRAARIATQLMELIDLQKLSPGDKLPPERQLADLLEVSRPSLREALHILQAQGLVQIKHGQGTYVQEPIVAQELRASMMSKTHGLNELFDAREVLEVPASKWSAEKATKEDIRLLRATLNQIDTVSTCRYRAGTCRLQRLATCRTPRRFPCLFPRDEFSVEVILE